MEDNQDTPPDTNEWQRDWIALNTSLTLPLNIARPWRNSNKESRHVPLIDQVSIAFSDLSGSENLVAHGSNIWERASNYRGLIRADQKTTGWSWKFPFGNGKLHRVLFQRNFQLPGSFERLTIGSHWRQDPTLNCEQSLKHSHLLDRPPGHISLMSKPPSHLKWAPSLFRESALWSRPLSSISFFALQAT